MLRARIVTPVAMPAAVRTPVRKAAASGGSAEHLWLRAGGPYDAQQSTTGHGPFHPDFTSSAGGGSSFEWPFSSLNYVVGLAAGWYAVTYWSQLVSTGAAFNDAVHSVAVQLGAIFYEHYTISEPNNITGLVATLNTTLDFYVAADEAPGELGFSFNFEPTAYAGTVDSRHHAKITYLGA